MCVCILSDQTSRPHWIWIRNYRCKVNILHVIKICTTIKHRWWNWSSCRRVPERFLRRWMCQGQAGSYFGPKSNKFKQFWFWRLIWPGHFLVGFTCIQSWDWCRSESLLLSLDVLSDWCRSWCLTNQGMHNFSHFVFHHLIRCHHHLSSVMPVELYWSSTCVSCSSWFHTQNDLCIQNPRVSECSIARVTSAWPGGSVRSPSQCLWVPSGPVRSAAETAERSGRADAGSRASSVGFSWTSISETEPELDVLYMRLIRLSEINDQLSPRLRG